MNNNNPNAADAPVPSPGTEQAVEQTAKQQQPAPAESSVFDTVSGAAETLADTAEFVGDVLSIFE